MKKKECEHQKNQTSNDKYQWHRPKARTSQIPLRVAKAILGESGMVWTHHQNSEEAGMSKDISGSELLALSLCSGENIWARRYFSRRRKYGRARGYINQNLRAETGIWKLYTNGASNEHGSEAGLILIDLVGAEYSYALRLKFSKSNNDAKYEALLASLKIATKMKVEKMHAFVDLKIGSKPVKGSYKAKGKKTKKYMEKALEMIRNFINFQLSHIPREENKKAKDLSKLAAVQCEGLTKEVLIDELNERWVDTAKVNAIIEEATRTWITPIQEYIEKGIIPEDVTKA
nr:reverse transcriptase domain-containing protein [Tanacetum cinerariifolium]